MPTFTNDFDRIKYYYDQGWATKVQLRQYVGYGKITPAEYETITDEPYVA
jgi:hypothetical protein